MKYDIIVIGSGPGGYVAAIRAAQLGKKVAVVERAEAGGVCLNWGCIPTKALLKSAQVYNYCKSAEHYGLDFAGEVRPNLEKIVARSRGVAETMNKGVLFLLKKNNVELINGFAKLKGNGRIDVDGTEYEADHIILATGARPREMPFMPIDGEHVISSKQALVLPKLPETMIVVGSGAIGSEFAYFYAALGVKVTIVEYLPQIMPLEDEEVAKTMERSFRKLKATILTSTTVKSVKVNAEGKCDVEVEGKKGTETLVDGELARMPLPMTSGRHMKPLMRDYRLYLNAIREIVEQMQDAGLRADMRVNTGRAAVDVRISIPVFTGRK